MNARSKIIFFLLLILGLTLTSSLRVWVWDWGLGWSVWIGKGVPEAVLAYSVGNFSIHNFSVRTATIYFPPAKLPLILYAVKFLHIYAGALHSALIMILRFVSLVVLLSLMTSVVSTLEMNHGIASLLQPLAAIGIHTDMLVMVIQIMLRFLPLLALRMEQIAKSQASRGAQWGYGQWGHLETGTIDHSLLIPLFLSTLEQSERIADAMLCRCYGVSARRSHYYEQRLNLADVLFILVGIGLTILIVFLQRLGY
jgi:energy-coupling factor transport system permease protein